jgi:hypothetical protein
MQYGFTPAEARAMFDRLRPEAAHYFDEPYFYHVPFYVEPETDPENIQSGSMAKTNNGGDSAITLDENYLPYMWEDELRLVLMHEMVHVVATPMDNPVINIMTAGHGPNFVQWFYNWGGYWGGTMGLRNIADVPWIKPFIASGWEEADNIDNSPAEPPTDAAKIAWLHSTI